MKVHGHPCNRVSHGSSYGSWQQEKVGHGNNLCAGDATDVRESLHFCGYGHGCPKGRQEWSVFPRVGLDLEELWTKTCRCPTKTCHFFGSENASKMQYRLSMLRQACNCYDLLNVHQMVTECKVSQYFSPHLSLHFQCYAVLMPLRTVQSPLNLHFWGFCAVIQSGTTANDENPVSHLNDSIVWCQQKIGFSHW